MSFTHPAFASVSKTEIARFRHIALTCEHRMWDRPRRRTAACPAAANRFHKLNCAQTEQYQRQGGRGDVGNHGTGLWSRVGCAGCRCLFDVEHGWMRVDDARRGLVLPPNGLQLQRGQEQGEEASRLARAAGECDGRVGRYAESCKRTQKEIERIKAWEAKCAKEEKRFEKAAEWTEEHFHLEKPAIAGEPTGLRPEDEGVSLQPSEIKNP